MTLHELIQAALKEDMPSGDMTTESLGVGPQFGKAQLLAKQDLVLSGSGAFEQTILLLEPNAKLKWHFEEGELVPNGQIVCTLLGDLVQILKAERISLNFIMHLSGIATLTAHYVAKVKHTPCRILDTRKTLPGYRDLEKRAVVHGGGLNHRKSLSSAVLLKDNHIALMKGIPIAVQRVRLHTKLPIEVEAATLSQVQECVDLAVDRILLDNMNDEMTKSALQLIPDAIEAEASGNMNLDRVQKVAELGVDFISVGALTHSAPSSDLSLKFDWLSKT